MRAATLQVPIGEHQVTLTVSIGVATRDATIVDADALVQCADVAQYRAKAEGRNRVVEWRGETFDLAPTGAGSR